MNAFSAGACIAKLQVNCKIACRFTVRSPKVLSWSYNTKQD